MKKIWFLLTLILIIVTLSGCAREPMGKIGGAAKPAHSSLVTPDQLNDVISAGGQLKSSHKGHIICGVVPHHLMATGPLDDFFSLLATQKPKLVVLIGPNHANQGALIMTGTYDWQTPNGRVVTEQRAIKALLKSGTAECHEQIMAKEHSVGALIPLVKHYLPEARVVPLILRREVGLEQVDILLEQLRPYLDENAVLISSVDFSHYLTRQESEAKDKQTLSYMRSFDYNNLFRLDNDHLDSPAALACTFRWAEKNGSREFRVLQNTNSGILMRNDRMQTTSYFTLVFEDSQTIRSVGQ